MGKFGNCGSRTAESARNGMELFSAQKSSRSSDKWVLSEVKDPNTSASLRAEPDDAITRCR